MVFGQTPLPHREESSMTTSMHPDDEPTGPLKEAIDQIRADQAPEDVMQQLLERAVALNERGAPPRLAFPQAWGWAAAAILVIAGAALTGWLLQGVGPPHVDQSAQEAPKPEAPKSKGAPMPPKADDLPPKNDTRIAHQLGGGFGLQKDGLEKTAGARGFGAQAGVPAGASPSRHFAVSPSATVLVSTGGKKPLRLGEAGVYDENMILHVWDWSKSDESRPLPASCATGMAVSPDGKSIVCRDGRVIDTATGAVRQLDGFDGRVHGLMFAPDGRTLLAQVVSDKNEAAARIFDFPAGKQRFQIPGVWWATFAGAFTPDSRQVLLMDKDRVLRRWDAGDGKELGRYEPAFDNSIRAIAVAPDGKQLAGAGTRGEIYLWDVAEPKARHKLVADGQRDATVLSGRDSLAFTPDGKHLAAGGLFGVILWDTAAGNVARRFPRASSSSAHLRFSGDGKLLTTVRDIVGIGRDGQGLAYPLVRHWEVATGKEHEGELDVKLFEQP
jgi:hypothetical protein